MNRILNLFPRNVAISVAVMVVAGLLFVLSFFVLGGARDESIQQNLSLTSQIATARTLITQSDTDKIYVQENAARYEALMGSDRLVPHSRRAAVVALQRASEQRGLSALSYSFSAAASDSLTAAKDQPQTGAYRLSVEEVVLKVGAPTDGQIYGLISDLTEEFPGSAIVQKMTLQRADKITDDALDAVSEGADSNLVHGDITLLWRTAQARDQQTAGAPK